MTLTELAQALNGLSYPVAYSHFKGAETPPFICYLVTDSDTFSADDKPIHEMVNVDIELYTAKKDLTAEKKIKDLLTQKELSWSFVETYIESEGVFKCTFSIQI